MPREEVFHINCQGCGEEVTPADIDWELFRNWGLHVHAKEDCYTKLADRLHVDYKLIEQEVDSPN